MCSRDVNNAIYGSKPERERPKEADWIIGKAAEAVEKLLNRLTKGTDRRGKEVFELFCDAFTICHLFGQRKSLSINFRSRICHMCRDIFLCFRTIQPSLHDIHVYALPYVCSFCFHDSVCPTSTGDIGLVESNRYPLKNGSLPACPSLTGAPQPVHTPLFSVPGILPPSPSAALWSWD